MKSGTSIASGETHPGAHLTFGRVPADDKTAKPVIHAVKELKS